MVMLGAAFKREQVPKVPRDHDYLFSEMDISAVLEDQRVQMENRAEPIPEQAPERKRA
jgi:hypothetical protein